MSGRVPYGFRPATPADRDLLLAWRATPHVRAWWGPATPGAESTQEDPRVSRWIVSLGARPIGFLQDYTVHGWDDHHFASLPKGTRGIDLYIGERDMIGLGHGSGLMAQRMRSLFAEGAPTIAVDPHPDNARAIAAYRRVRFEVFGPPRGTKWGRILPMRVDAPGPADAD